MHSLYPWESQLSVDRPCLQIAHNVFSIMKVNALQNSAQVQHLFESYFLLEKNPNLSEVLSYVFDCLFKHHLTRDNSLVLIRSCGKEVYKVEKSKEDT